MTILSTIYDIYVIYRKIKPWHSILLAFSLWTNSKKLFSVNRKSNQLHCLNGLKSLSMIWIVMAHAYIVYSVTVLDNYSDGYNWLKNTSSQYVINAMFSVDTFLVIGGFLTVYTYQIAMDKGLQFNVAKFYLHRYLRLTPALAAMLLAHIALFNYLGSGPIWDHTDVFLVQMCRKYWWSALLYIQNYVNPKEIVG